MTLDGVGGAAGACEEEGESVAKEAELVEVRGAVGLAIEEGDGLEGDEDDVGCVGRAKQSAVQSVLVPSGNRGPGFAWCLAHWLGTVAGPLSLPTGPGDGILRPLTEEVGMGAGYVKFAALDGVGCEFAGADGVAVVEEIVIAPADVEAVVVVVPVDEEGKWG